MSASTRRLSSASAPTGAPVAVRIAGSDIRSSRSAGRRSIWASTVATFATRSGSCAWDEVRSTATGGRASPVRCRHDRAWSAAVCSHHSPTACTTPVCSASCTHRSWDSVSSRGCCQRSTASTATAGSPPARPPVGSPPAGGRSPELPALPQPAAVRRARRRRCRCRKPPTAACPCSATGAA